MNAPVNITPNSRNVCIAKTNPTLELVSTAMVAIASNPPGLVARYIERKSMSVGYVVQSGTFKNVGVTWRNAIGRSNFLNDINENRLILTYSVPLW